MVTEATGGLDGNSGQTPAGGEDDAERAKAKAKVWAWALACAVVVAVLAGAYAIASSGDLDSESASGNGAVTTQPLPPTSAPSSTAPTTTAVSGATTMRSTTTTVEATTTTAGEGEETTSSTVATTEPPAPTTTVPTTMATTSIPPNGTEIVPGLRFGVSSELIRKGFEATLLNKRACDAMNLLTSIPAFSSGGQALTPDLIKEYVSAWRTLATLMSASHTDGVATSSADVREIFGAAMDLIESDGYAPGSLVRLSQPISVNGRVVSGADLQVAVATKHQWELSHCPSDLTL